MGLIFILIGISLLYLSTDNEKDRYDYKLIKLLDGHKKIFLISDLLCFQKEENVYSLKISKKSPSNFHENMKIYYAIQFLFFSRLKRIKAINKIIILKYIDKEWQFIFDEDTRVKIFNTMNKIFEQRKNTKDISDFLIDTSKLSTIKCKNCFQFSQCFGKI